MPVLPIRFRQCAPAGALRVPQILPIGHVAMDALSVLGVKSSPAEKKIRIVLEGTVGIWRLH